MTPTTVDEGRAVFLLNGAREILAKFWYQADGLQQVQDVPEPERVGGGWETWDRISQNPLQIIPAPGVSDADFLDFMCREGFKNLRFKMSIAPPQAPGYVATSSTWMEEGLRKSHGYKAGE